MIHRIILTTILLTLVSVCTISAQIKYGLRLGGSTSDIDPEQLIQVGTGQIDQLTIAFKEADYGFHAGGFLQWQINRFFVQPEVLFTSGGTTYTVDGFANGAPTSIEAEEAFQSLEMPLMLGAKFGPLRLQAGPVGNLYLSSSSDLFDFPGYEEQYDRITWGAQGGIGLDVWRIVLDIKYETALSKYGSHISFNGQRYNFDDREQQLVISLGIDLAKRDRD